MKRVFRVDRGREAREREGKEANEVMALLPLGGPLPTLAARFPASLEGQILCYVDQRDVLAIHKDRWRTELWITK